MPPVFSFFLFFFWRVKSSFRATADLQHPPGAACILVSSGKPHGVAGALSCLSLVQLDNVKSQGKFSLRNTNPLMSALNNRSLTELR